ncbi:aminotransferase class I/II-fold pyridoxal phosphate-dependent enzyme [Psychrobacillus psychrodurans]|jgi:aspartate/methionine/tyrosine aminotransferase|uniref:Aminotransferase class I/II-fold pyridoxal phosphate-dependent enzyme n=1 Tax=Psychrobacillus psychrodurans TaxID=126157 RepID=A0A9X3RA73_9BACI|nr:aminotransferase class I/II-fold pyridoxal phosphate-dependent enzyme [Psychrobacillus psychrodurans]MCZ8534314.1 aminotransferase class I/II-fold pyridoxal phosphate-dependent enzyme [Psychrobacillus psychrodurans]
MNALAAQLNEKMQNENPAIYNMLSDLGKNLYYPKGILSQSAEAGKKAHRFNATIGIATENGEPMHFRHIQNKLDYKPNDIYPYAAPQGKEALRSIWKEKLLVDNPSMKGKSIGTPIVTSALTHGLSIAADLFMDAGDVLVTPQQYWGNYNTVFQVRRGGRVETFPLFNEAGGFHVEAFRETIAKQTEKVIVLLNFPNNPTGFTPSVEEAEAIVQVLKDAAEGGLKLVVLLDDAYFGLFYEDSIKESLFGLLADSHMNILPVKIDGATKENYVWGLRVGFITYAADPDTLDALEQKTKGIIRGTISSGSHISQTILLESLQSEEFSQEKEEKFQIMQGRAIKTKQVLADEKYAPHWTYYPFNSGYFMCLKLNSVDAETLRLHLLDQYGVGVIASNKTDIRVAFSCVEENDIQELFDLIYEGCKDLTK